MATSPSADLQADSSFTDRLRARSKSLLEKLHRSPSRGSDGSRGSVTNAVGKAGVQAGVLASPLVDPEQQRQDVKKGAFVFLQELERVASQPAPKPGLKRTGTIELVRDDKSEKDVHPITNVEDNPFALKEEDTGPRDYDFAEDIWLINHENKHFARALLDTGMEVNAMRLETANECGFTISDYTGRDLQDIDGPDVEIIGKVDVPFYFKDWHSARTWTVEFVVLREPPFDVALGRGFINLSGLIKRADVVLPFAFKDQTSTDKQHQQQRTKEKNSSIEATKAEARRKMEQREQADRERERRKKSNNY